ncbi:protein Shroom1-like isoform X1 [Sinocyclocheilus grahami]|uniref:Protein Shroom3-like n=1 Tax=Sinocyclocheilus grahami TaxID=75366 RepID=A0A672QSG9_SINGR|nr:PREDICTED: protein Shroom1-like isoform X1 [Sinocyclocheilus grahami]
MDSYHFHFERMSNLDLHPLSLPVSRLSPAKSSSSIDQYTHHHSKGDSAYSSFSGGSTVPDYPSPFLLDELQSQNLHHTELKYVKGKYSPTFLDSDSKSMDHLYRSMETVAQEHHWSSGGFSDIEDPPVHTHPLPPPPPPARLNSLATTRNLENSRARQSPEGQLADLSTSQQTSNSEVCGVRAEPGYGCTFSQLKDHLKQDPEDKMLDPPKPTGIVNKSPLQTCQPEPLQQSWSSQSETQRKRSHSAYGGPVSEHQCFVSSCHMPQNMISGSIQHKGQFYFVTGVFKSSEPSAVQGVGEGAETSSEWSYKVQRRRQSCPDGPSGKLFYQEEHKFSIQNEVVEHPNDKAVNSPFKSEQTSEGVEDQRVISRETGRHHSTSHPIFYCGPEDNSVGTLMTPALIKEDHTSHPKKEEQMTRVSRRPQLDIPNDKISKEITPLLYHLTGANRALYTDKFKNNNDVKNPDCSKDKEKAEKDEQTPPSSEYRQSEMSKEKQTKEFFYPCGTLDDSYKKYYKEKLKDAQSKVLRETSFKRRDLQLSQPHRIMQQTDKQLFAEPSGPPFQDKLSNLETPPMPQLHNPQEKDKEYRKDLGQEIEKAIEKEPEKPQNIAQPQVPRVGSRKRLTADQKKLSHSEPEKLHQLADGPAHMTCHSLGNEAEDLLSEGDHGLVAARRKMFKTRGRALSASNFSKSTLKHLQHKALVAYMERKTGQKIAEPQHPVPQVPSCRSSTAESSRHNSGISDSKKLDRPLSAGQILDSVSSSVKYTQFIAAKHSRQSSWREESSTAGKSASVENLLDQPEQPKCFRTRSTSTPHAFQVQKHPDEFSANHNKAILSVQGKVEEETVVHHSHTASVPDERHVQVRASRGKSMEELGVSKVTRPDALSKSSEQLDQLQGKQVNPGAEKRMVAFLAEGRRTHRRIPSSGEHTDSSQAGPEKPLLTHFVKHVSSHDDEIHTASHNGCKNKEDMVLSMPSHSRPEVSKEQDVCPRDKSETSLSCQEVSLGHGVTTDPSLWITTSEINEDDANYWPSTETATSAEPQNAPRSPSDENETTSITTLPGIQETESSLVPALNGEQDRNVKKEDCPVVMEDEVLEGNGPADKLEWEVLVRDVVSADQSLAGILYPVTNRKTALMLMEQLLSEDTLLMEEHYKKKQEQKVNNPEKAAHSTEMPVGEKPLNLASSVNNQSVLSNQKESLHNTDIIDKKRRLIAHIEEHLKCLEEVRSTVQSEEKMNGERGDAMEALVGESCVSAELERYTQFIGDLERVVSLLLCLSARLARVQNALSTADDSMDAEERQSLDIRYRLLCKQREDAKDLKDNLDRRERMVSTFLSKQLTDTQLQEYRRFIQTKASLLIRQKDLDEKQRLGEEQLEALLSSLPP